MYLASFDCKKWKKMVGRPSSGRKKYTLLNKGILATSLKKYRVKLGTVLIETVLYGDPCIKKVTM